MGWKDIEQAKGSKDFLKIKDGDAVDIVVMGEPKTFYSIFKDPKEYETKVEGSKFTFKVNVVVKEDDQYVGKILSGGFFLAQDLHENVVEHGQDTVFKLKRKGEGINTRYHVLFKAKLTPEQMETFKNIELPPLEKIGQSEDGIDFNQETDEDVPF